MTVGSQAKKRSWFSPLFVIAVLVVVAGSLGLGPALRAMVSYYRKEPIALRRLLDEFDDSRLRSFMLAGPGHGYRMAEGDVETEDVIYRIYELRATSGLDLGHEYAMLFVTYYSDPRSTIPLEVPGLGPGGQTIDARLLDIEQNGRRLALLYVFCSNGEFYYDRERVRMAIAMPGDKYTYFSKVEALTSCPPDTTFKDSVERCKRLLSEALPVLVEEHYPRDEDLKRR